MKKYYILCLCLLSFACSYTNEERCLKNMPLTPTELDGFVAETIETKNHQFYDCLKRTNLIDKKQLLTLALSFQDRETIKTTLESLDERSGESFALFPYMAYIHDSPEIIRAFNNLDIEIDSLWPSKRYAQQALLGIAIESDNLKAVKRLIEKGASIYQDIDGTFPINLAASKGNLPIVKFLTAKGADITLRNQSYPHGNALYYAMSSGSIEIVKFLLNQNKTQFKYSRKKR